MKLDITLRLEEIEGSFHNFTADNGDKYAWTATTANYPILLEGARYHVTAIVRGQYEHVGRTWTKLARPKFTGV